LPARPADVLEEAKALQVRTRDRQNVIGIVRTEGAELPAQRSDIQFLGAAEAGLDGAGDDLLQRRVGNKKRGNDAGMCRIGAAKFERRRRAVGFRIAGIGGQLRRDLVGTADDRIETKRSKVSLPFSAVPI